MEAGTPTASADNAQMLFSQLALLSQTSLRTECGPNYDQYTTVLSTEGLTRRGAQVTPVVLETIGAVEIKLFIQENNCVPIRFHHHVPLGANLSRFLVLECER